MWLLSSSKNIVPIKSYATFKSSKFATLPQDLQSLLIRIFLIFSIPNFIVTVWELHSVRVGCESIYRALACRTTSVIPFTPCNTLYTRCVYSVLRGHPFPLGGTQTYINKGDTTAGGHPDLHILLTYRLNNTSLLIHFSPV